MSDTCKIVLIFKLVLRGCVKIGIWRVCLDDIANLQIKFYKNIHVYFFKFYHIISLHSHLFSFSFMIIK